MAITLGKDGDAPPFGTGIISATLTTEVETVDITNRDNCGGSAGSPGHRVSMAGLESNTWEIECHDPDGLVASLEGNANGAYHVMSITENVSIDGAVTYSVTCREG